MVVGEGPVPQSGIWSLPIRARIEFCNLPPSDSVRKIRSSPGTLHINKLTNRNQARGLPVLLPNAFSGTTFYDP